MITFVSSVYCSIADSDGLNGSWEFTTKLDHLQDLADIPL